jgi:hypothetical protein
MLETGAYGKRMAGYLHLAEPPIYALLGSGRSKLAVTRLHAPNGFTDPTSTIPLEMAFSIHLHLRANRGGRLWLSADNRGHASRNMHNNVRNVRCGVAIQHGAMIA